MPPPPPPCYHLPDPPPCYDNVIYGQALKTGVLLNSRAVCKIVTFVKTLLLIILKLWKNVRLTKTNLISSIGQKGILIKTTSLLFNIYMSFRSIELSMICRGRALTIKHKHMQIGILSKST